MLLILLANLVHVHSEKDYVLSYFGVIYFIEMKFC